MLILIQLSIMYYVGMQAMVHVPVCNKKETMLSNLIASTFDKDELPSDLLPLVQKIKDSNTTVLIQNCSDILTLKQYLYERLTKSIKRDVPKLYYTTLYAYVEMKYQTHLYTTYIPKTNADIVLLTNSFASAGLNPVLERKLHLFFFYYGNWLEKLTESKFSFNKYKQPRTLLLNMICELINDPLYRVYEREVIFFLILNNHTCFFIENYYRHINVIKNLHSGDFQNTHAVPKRPLQKHDSSSKIFNNLNLENKTKINNANSSSDIILFQNVSITILNNKALPNTSFVHTENDSKLFLNFSIVQSSNLKRTNVSHDNGILATTLKDHQTSDITTSSFLNNKPITSLASNYESLKTNRSAQIKIPFYNISTITTTINIRNEELVTTPYLLDMLRQKHSNLSHINATHSDINQNYQRVENQHILNFTVWDIVEMDGPCKEGQQHVVKLNVQSLLTAIDEHVANSSVDLFRKLLSNVKAFPIEDYNARGELLRDLLLVISKEEADPTIKKSIEDILDHVILDGPGALPPKIKLECVHAPEGNLKRAARRTGRIFDLLFE